MDKKKDSLLARRLKYKIIGGMITIVVFISPFIFFLIMIVGVMPAAEAAVADDYKSAAELAGCSWQELLAFDTVRYENNFDDADPYLSALEFMSIYYEKYNKVRNKDGSYRWVLSQSGWLNSPADIRDFFRLPIDAGAMEVTNVLKSCSPPEYVISVNAKDVEDVNSEHEFDQDQKEWIGMLITEGVLGEMFGEEYDLPDFITAGNGYFGWPLPGVNRITDTYGPRIHPVTGERSYHYGVDIGATEGTPVAAIDAGIVTGTSYYGGTAGINVKIRHEKDGYVWESKYFHLSQIEVSVGEAVERGTVIAASGNTGRSTGPHLHIGITLNGSYVDPLPLTDK